MRGEGHGSGPSGVSLFMGQRVPSPRAASPKQSSSGRARAALGPRRGAPWPGLAPLLPRCPCTAPGEPGVTRCDPTAGFGAGTVPHTQRSARPPAPPSPSQPQGGAEPPVPLARAPRYPGLLTVPRARRGGCWPRDRPRAGLRGHDLPVPPSGRSNITRCRELSESQLAVCVLPVRPWKPVYFFASINSEFPQRFYVFPEINIHTHHTHTFELLKSVSERNQLLTAVHFPWAQGAHPYFILC